MRKKHFRKNLGSLMHLMDHLMIDGNLMARTYNKRPWVCIEFSENSDKCKWQEATDEQMRLYNLKLKENDIR